MTSIITATHSPTPIRTEIATLWRLSWPMLVGQLATVGMGVADVAMTGHVSAAELAAVSLGTSVWSIILVTVMGIMMAVNSVVAHEMGAGRFDRISHSVRESLWMGLIVGVAGCLAANACALLFDHIGLEQAVADRAKTFLHIISLGMPAFGCYRALYGYTTSINQTKPIMIIAICGLAYNVALNWILVFGQFGFPKLGALGCAVSTASGVWLMLAAMVGWIRVSAAYRATYPFTRWEGPNWSEIGSMLRLGLPIGVTHFAEVSAFGVVSLLVARFGVVQVSAHQIALNFISLVFMVPLSFGIGTLTRVGQAIGEGNPVRARFVAWTGTGLCMSFGLLSAAFIALFRWQVAAMYTSDAAVQATCAMLLLFAAVFQLSDSTQVAAASAIRGYKVTRSPMVIQMIAFWGVALPVGWILGLAPGWFPWSPGAPMQATGFWIGLVLGLTVAAVLLAWSLNRLAKLRVREAVTPR
ncbi:multidrug transporter MATE [Massilia sp. WF1]|uniref:MATE family efflux transporter n=1 Tax=unclassified Massilia TaxID=2609279 RepID=UPI00064B7E66|nr:MULTISPECIES: MATE family efflux transporter [unclassified Massilia]ALK96226.1 MATE family efflux transporter [Massilia sp. WG5]KLU36199.1 multidrug transporter MATE [Massilia sp. WF1]